jgi:hypothetical protein
MTKAGCNALPVPVLFVASRCRVPRHRQALEMAPRSARRRAANQSRSGKSGRDRIAVTALPPKPMFGSARSAYASRSRGAGPCEDNFPAPLPAQRKTTGEHPVVGHLPRRARPRRSLRIEGERRNRTCVCKVVRGTNGRHAPCLFRGTTPRVLSRLDLARGRLRLGLLAATAPLRLSSPARAAHSSRGKKVSPRRPPLRSGSCGVRRRPPRAGRSPSRPRWARSR